MTNTGCEKIEANGLLLAIILRSRYQPSGIEFFTAPEMSQQLAVMSRPAGHVVRAHHHRPVKRLIMSTQEVLFVRHGMLRIDLYDRELRYVSSHDLLTGDVALLAAGGHRVEFIENSDVVEVKQGPFLGDEDKVFIGE